MHNVFTEYLHIYKVHIYLITAFAQAVKEIANARFLKEPSLAVQMAECGYQQLKACFDIREMVSKT